MVARRDRRTYRLGPTLSLHAPLVQAPLGACDGPRLAAAVSRAGALGCLSVHAPEPDALRRDLARIRQQTPRPVLLAFTAPFERESLPEIAVGAGFRHFQVNWWNGPRLTPHLHALGATVFWQVGTPDQAREALEVGADILIVPGREAGGPVRTPFRRAELLTAVREIAGPDIPLVSGGGLATREDVACVLAQGADAALLGTRFLLTDEARCPDRHKARLVRSTERDLVLDIRLVGDWPCAPRRRVFTATGEDAPGLFAGRGVSHIHRVAPAAEIVRSLLPSARYNPP